MRQVQPNTAFAQNVGLVSLTRVKSRYVVAAAGAILIMLGLFPKAASAVASVPNAVLGGAGLAMFGMAAANGIKTLARVKFDSTHNMMVVAISLAIGLVPLAVPNFYDKFPDWTQIILHSGITAGSITALILNAILNGPTPAEEKEPHVIFLCAFCPQLTMDKGPQMHVIILCKLCRDYFTAGGEDMDAVSHAVIGLAVAGLSGHPLAVNDPVYIAAVLGSQAPDFDIIAIIRGRTALLRQHRVLSHSLPGIAALAGVIAVLVHSFMPQAAILSLFMWAFAGALSHILVDFLNTHGAALLWPVCIERKSCHLLNVFDPILMALMLSMYLFKLPMRQLSIITFMVIAIYIALRLVLRERARRLLCQHFGVDSRHVTVMPSLNRIIFWDFVIEGDGRYYIGEIGALHHTINIKTDLPKQNMSPLARHAQASALGEFFSIFTPFSYFDEVHEDGATKVCIYDLRYFCEQGFVHSGTIVFDQQFMPTECYISSYGKKLKF